MAGGTFDKLVGKVRPGTYINFQSGRIKDTTVGSRGVALIPLFAADYGPAGEYIKITAESPDAEMAKLGYSIYDEDEGRQMLYIREAIKHAETVLVYIVNADGGAKASATVGGATATAKYAGARGNELTVTVAANPVAGYDVTVHLADEKVWEYEGVKDIADLISKDCPYIDFEGDGDLSEDAGQNLSGGASAEATNQNHSDFMDSWESVHFNTVCYPTKDESLQAAVITKIKYMRNNMGKGVQAVMPDVENADYQGIISVTNAVEIDDDKLTHAEACAWVAGATAGADKTESLTFVEYDGATGLVDAKTHEQAVEAINDGEFFFSISEAGAVVAEYDINTLVNFVDGTDESYRKNRVIRVFDSLQADIQQTFPPNKFPNNEVGWGVMEGLGAGLLMQYQEDGALQNVDVENDFKVDRTRSEGDQTYFDVLIQPVDSSEKLYFTVTTM